MFYVNYILTASHLMVFPLFGHLPTLAACSSHDHAECLCVANIKCTLQILYNLHVTDLRNSWWYFQNELCWKQIIQILVNTELLFIKLFNYTYFSQAITDIILINRYVPMSLCISSSSSNKYSIPLFSAGIKAISGVEINCHCLKYHSLQVLTVSNAVFACRPASSSAMRF